MKFETDTNGTRRKFVKGLAVGGTVVGLGLTGCSTKSTKAMSKSATSNATNNVKATAENKLSGKVFNLTIDEQRVNFTGKNRIAIAVNGVVPSPVLRWKEGDTVTLNVTNKLSVDSSIHWHGIILPNNMDGVPGLTFGGIKPGETFTYKFPLIQSGTYWYHSHSGFQETQGMAGSIVIEPKKPYPYKFDRDYVVTLTDWSDEQPKQIYAKLKKMSHYYNFNERTAMDLLKELKANGLKRTYQDREMWNNMRMSQRDLSDVTGYTYTYLMNGQTPRSGWKGLFKKGEKVLLRFVNASAMSFFDVRIPGLKMTVVATDGQDIQPVSVDEVRIGVAETYDVIVEPDASQAYTIFAQSLGRTGYARGTLTPDGVMTAAVPKLDPVPNLTHTDMGMDMSSMDHAGHDMSAMAGAMADKKMDHSKMDHSKNMPKMDCSDPMHASMDHCKEQQASKVDHSKMEHSKMDHSKMNHTEMKMPTMDCSDPMHAAMDHCKEQANKKVDHATMDHSKMAMKDMPANSNRIKHAATEYGPHVDMRAENPEVRLSDPGIGLRGNGRRVLTYADIKNLHPTHDKRPPSREIELHLTGNMSRYMWSFNGVKYADAKPIIMKYGERLRIILVNDTMMNHPIHLHGMWSELETGDNDYLPRKHTIVVQPGAKITYLVTADARGRWAYHCHLQFHMSGMFREVKVV